MLTPGEITKGMVFTVHSWKPRESSNFDMSGVTTKTTFTDRSYLGDVFTVTAVMIPFIVADRHENIACLGPTLKLDTREVNLMEVTDEYVKALKK